MTRYIHDPKVVLLGYTPEPEKTIAAAVRQCYSDSSVDAILAGMSQEEAESIVRKLLGFGHLSGIEHASFTFYIEGVSRAFTHQLVRHRLASYSQQSQRYVKFDNDIPFVVPPSYHHEVMNSNTVTTNRIERDFNKLMDDISNLYHRMLDAGIPAEDARFIIPNGVETKITVTMNARELYHLFGHRCCKRAQWEMRRVAWEMFKLASSVAPVLFEQAGPGCLYGKCPEGKMTCGDPYQKEAIPNA